eukprot:12909230-Prorocentrum_lima.AAC.1
MEILSSEGMVTGSPPTPTGHTNVSFVEKPELTSARYCTPLKQQIRPVCRHCVRSQQCSSRWLRRSSRRRT